MKKLLSITLFAAFLASTAARAADTLIVVGIPPDTTLTIFYSNALTDSTEVIITNVGAVTLSFCVKAVQGEECGLLGTLVNQGEQKDTTILGLGGVAAGYYINVTNYDVELTGSATVMLKDIGGGETPPPPPSCDAWCTTGNAVTNPVTAFLGTTTVTDLIFKTNVYYGGGERMRITYSGDVGINNPNPLAKLDVAGTGLFSENVTIGTNPVDINLNVIGDAVVNGNLNAGSGLFSGGVNAGSGSFGSMNVAANGIFLGNVGIGTLSVPHRLNVNGSVNLSTGSQYLINGVSANYWEPGTGAYSTTIHNTNYGYVGIGNPTPQVALDVSGSLIVGNSWGGNGYGYIKMTYDGVHNQIDANLTELQINHNSGQDVSIGGQLSVCGKLRVHNDGCDFVFADDYQRMPWQVKELYYKTHKRLPNLDPASEMQRDGMDVAKNFSGMLQNVEENTLDITELYKRMEKIEKQNERLIKENEKLKEQLEAVVKK